MCIQLIEYMWITVSMDEIVLLHLVAMVVQTLPCIDALQLQWGFADEEVAGEPIPVAPRLSCTVIKCFSCWKPWLGHLYIIYYNITEVWDSAFGHHSLGSALHTQRTQCKPTQTLLARAPRPAKYCPFGERAGKNTAGILICKNYGANMHQPANRK